MPRAVANATKTIEAVNGVEYDKPTDGYDEDFLPTSEQNGRYKILTPRAHSFTSYGIRFVEGIGRTDELLLANRLHQEFGYKVIDTGATAEPASA